METLVIQKAVLKALSLALMAAILLTGYEAVTLTHVQARVTFTFGDPPQDQVNLAEKLDAKLFDMPLPDSVKLPRRKPARQEAALHN